MDYEKPYSSPSRGMPARRSRYRPLVIMGLASLGIFLLFHIRPLYSIPGPFDLAPAAEPPVVHTKTTLVPLEAHIMSKCPDARDCLRDLILPAMQRTHDKVNFTLSYIGKPTTNDGVDCKHGPEECMGNIIELCAAQLYPDPKTYLGFTMCITRDYKSIPMRSLIEDCALEHAIDFQKLNECVSKDDGGYGTGLLRDSVRRSSEAGVTKSCTVRLDEKIYCIRDGGQWVDCPAGPAVSDLVNAIEQLHSA